MKKICMGVLLSILSGPVTYAQWTTAGTTTTTSNTIGVGTANPQSNVEISNGSYSSGNQLIISGGETSRYYGVVETTVPSGHTVFSLGTKSDFINYFQTLNLLNGNVGIGTMSPATSLDINAIGTTFLRGYYPGGQSLQFATGSAGAVIVQKGTGFLAFNTNSDGDLISPSNERMRIDNNGNVGIGTMNPTAKLTIAGSGNINPNTGAETDYNGLNLTFKGESGGSGFNLGSIKMVQPAGAYLDNADMVFSTCLQSTTEKMRISSIGNVGIGTTMPDAKLAVNGTIHSKEVKVDLAGWPDYVFKPTYNLKPLSEVKTYIDQNHHLPEMPSEKEVTEKGLNLGELVKLQTKKIEELTLYLIEKDKQLNEQTKTVEKLSERLSALEAKSK